MKKIIYTMALALLSTVGISHANSIIWGVQSTSPYTWYDHNGVAMVGNPSGSSYLIQLIYAGSSIDSINMGDADGTGGDDVMVAFSKFGTGMFPRVDGKTEPVAYANSTYANGSLFYMRAWEGVSAGAGATPAGVLWYGNSMTFTLSGYNVDPALESDATFFATANLGGNSGAYQMAAVVPEPATISLLLVGVSLVAFSRLRKS
jgi:hypothetical protein